MRLEYYFTDIDNIYLGSGLNGNPIVIGNLSKTLSKLGYRLSLKGEYDSGLADAVYRFQEDNKHNNIDGIFGPGTRDLLLRKIKEENLNEIVLDLVKPYQVSEVGKKELTEQEKVLINIEKWLSENGVKIEADREFILSNNRFEFENSKMDFLEWINVSMNLNDLSNIQSDEKTATKKLALEKIKSEIPLLLAGNEPLEAIKMLMKNAELFKSDFKLYGNLIYQLALYDSNEKYYRLGTISNEDKNVNLNKIINAILYIIEKI